eukprot:TRINITY_DN5590_c0_g1_i1.p1 TRINITY_DN5590_c0_g1~~TRINITY_DN5590_c0_g1_i1.p1  ORF type:complete len:368 (+),score=66.55 TRINITY_DN5590_c0_g1_i1:88-1191(+)
MRDLPEGIEQLEHLEILDVSGNDILYLPEGIEKLESLRRLTATHNYIEKLPDDLDDLRELEQLNLIKNRLKEVPEAIIYIRDRVEVSMFSNKLSDTDFTEAELKRKCTKCKDFKSGFADMTGRRPTMEDSLMIKGNLTKQNFGYFSLFDGHAGRFAASFCTEHMHTHLETDIDELSLSPAEALKSTFSKINKKFEEFATKSGIVGMTRAGTTGVAMLLDAATRKCVVANVGDSRAILCRKGIVAKRLSLDHKPYDDAELERIKKLGGHVVGNTGRVNGQLAVSRAIGDFYLDPFVTPEPHITEIDLSNDDEFLILACDGVWDVISDQRACEIVAGETDPSVMARKLRDYAYLCGSDDNISVICVMLN